MPFPFVARYMNKILFATTNPGKIKEIKLILKNLNIAAVSPQDIPNAPKDVAETGTTFADNACIKAEAFAKASNLITLADDTGLEVDALDGRPGVYSARYAPTDEKRNSKLLNELKNVPQAQRTARFVSVICIYDPKTNTSKMTKGKIEGRITTKPKGKRGFGYDPIFYAFELKKTFGEASIKEKNQISHRARALQKAAKLLKSWK